MDSLSNPSAAAAKTTTSRSTEYKRANREAVNASNARYRAAHPEKNREWQERYRKNNPEQFKKSQREYRFRRYWSDPEYRLKMQLRSRLSKCLGRGGDKTATIAQCGCSFAELRAHLEANFQPGMSWDKRNEWHIDHFYPLGEIDINNRLHVLAVCNWQNLRPVWARENWVKNAKVTPEAKELFESILKQLSPENHHHATEV